MEKTELARAICAELYGDERRLIRLAMSEYAHDWAVSRLVGPMPGYVRSAGPESWLTTRVRHQPDTAVLLDEIEKAHPTVWNTFLEVLDVGWLSDSCGTSTDFSRTVVMMSSNLGAKAFSSRPIGFDPSPERVEPAEGRVLDAVKGAMAPELVNRLDGVVVVHPLPSEALVDSTAKEVGDVVDRLSAVGYRLTIHDAIVDQFAKTAYAPAHGALHLHRNIERLLLQLLAEAADRTATARMKRDEIVWSVT